jgi:hypothetical protein
MAGPTQRGARGHERSPRRGLPAVAAAAASGPAPRATFRLLQQKGLTPGEAASLTAFMCGLPTTDLRWSLRQINQMLFLQRLYQLGRFGIGDDVRTRPH